MKKLFLVFVLSSFYSFSQDSLQVQKTKLSVIELEGIKVVYRSIENPITIAVPNNVKSFIVSGPGVSPNKETGKYIIKPGVGKEIVVKVEMILQDNSIVLEEHVYQIKGIPAPIGTLNEFFNSKGVLGFKIYELKDAIVGIKMVDFLLALNLEVSQFNIKVPRFPTLVITGNVITNEAYEIIKRARKKDIIVISEIKGKCFGYDGFIRYPRPLTFKIID
jgi:hypothetical protein